MADQTVIQIKRSTSTAAPTTLSAGELAYTSSGGVLYIGNPADSVVTAIGGVRNPGTLTANQALVANSTSGIDKVIVANLQPVGLYANGSLGSAGQVLYSNSTGVYWADSAAGALGELTDTNITTPADGSLLLYDTGTSKWIDNVMSGDATLADTGELTLATVNDDAGTYGDANTVGVFTIDAKGRITNASSTDIDHDALLNFASNEHIDHTTVSVSAGDGLSGGGDISSSRTLSVLANNGIVANSTGVFVDAGDGIVVNSTGVHVSTTLSGSFQFDDLTVSGNLVVNGTTTELNITTLVVEDSLIKLASNNTGDSIDFGFYGQYEDTGTKYAGLYRDASDGTGVFKLFDSLATEPTGTTVGGGTLAALDVGALDASSLVLGSALAVSYGGTGQTSLTDNAVVVGNGTSAVELVTGSAYQVLQVNGSGAVVFGSLDAGTF